ncbi:hypothetical protein [Mangrovicoccus sp. HB161399]|uniref:hypothetical protein n=1 Tax=Mangrovicoccus sp. HB161399 TaxID=2720392 RepID=UPI00155288E4|nr:hypothetical protein [Mangrovicoccus sp. HB161399]
MNPDHPIAAGHANLGCHAFSLLVLTGLGRFGMSEMCPAFGTLPIFAALPPLSNGLLDALSYSVTPSLLTWGFGRGIHAAWLGSIDLFTAIALFPALGHAITALLGLMAWDWRAGLRSRRHADPAAQLSRIRGLADYRHGLLHPAAHRAACADRAGQLASLGAGGLAAAIGQTASRPGPALGLVALWTVPVLLAALSCCGLYEAATLVFDTEMLTAYPGLLYSFGLQVGAIP